MSCSTGRNAAVGERPTSRGNTFGHLDAGEAALAGVGVGDHRRQDEGEVGDVRERVAGIDGQRREHREDPLLEELDRAHRGRRRSRSAQRTMLRYPSSAQRRAPAGRGTTASCRSTSSATARPIVGELLGRRAPVRRRAGRCPAAIWSFSAATRTWKNSSRFVEVIAQNFARSSSGMPGSAGELRARGR